MKAQRTHEPPVKINDLGDGTFHYNFDIVESEQHQNQNQNENLTEETNPEIILQYNYDQVRCEYPVELEKIQEALIAEGYDHIASI
jgi:hypothetical protein